jgi:hypothetical protein
LKQEKFYVKSKEVWERDFEKMRERDFYQRDVLKLLLWELIAEIFVFCMPDNPKNFSTGGERSNLKNIGTIFIALQLHWSNGYCVSPSSSDDG